MKSFLMALLAVAMALTASAEKAFAHGFSLSLNSYSDPTSISAVSESQTFDNDEVSPSPENVFTDLFSANTISDSTGTYYDTVEGFAVKSVSFPPYTATFNIVSPLYYSDGLGSGTNPAGPVVAQPASAGTYANIFDTDIGVYAGASPGNVILTGTTSYASGFGVSLDDPHELEKDLYLSTTSAQTNGEYGFAYTVSVNFGGGNTITTGPLVDVFGLTSFGDPSVGNATYLQQDAASVAIYQAATRFEPPSWSMATSGSWNNLSNWANWPGNGIMNSPPFGAGVQVAIKAATTTPLTITLDSPQTVGTLIFGNSASNTAGYTLAPGASGTLTLSNLTAGAQIIVTGGSNAITANTVLADNLWITPAAGTTLQISGNISEATPGESLTLDGPGTLVLSGSDNYTGGTTVSAGTLEVENSTALEPGSALSVGAGSELLFGNTISADAVGASPSSAFPTPEPGTLTLLILGGLTLLVAFAHTRRQI